MQKQRSKIYKKKKRGVRKHLLLFPVDLCPVEICQWPKRQSAFFFLRQSRENEKTMCSAKQRDFDVYAGKTEMAINKNVKFYSLLQKPGKEWMPFITVSISFENIYSKLFL